jgi:hypothetical protein
VVKARTEFDEMNHRLYTLTLTSSPSSHDCAVAANTNSIPRKEKHCQQYGACDLRKRHRVQLPFILTADVETAHLGSSLVKLWPTRSGESTWWGGTWLPIVPLPRPHHTPPRPTTMSQIPQLPVKHVPCFVRTGRRPPSRFARRHDSGRGPSLTKGRL